VRGSPSAPVSTSAAVTATAGLASSEELIS
jgi:hypothetical protein